MKMEQIYYVLVQSLLCLTAAVKFCSSYLFSYEQYLKKHGLSAATLEDPTWVSKSADKGNILTRG